MSSRELPHWYPDHPPLYDIEKSYLENAEEGPFFAGVIPERRFPPQEQWRDFLGVRIASCIGVPAGPLLNARWVALAASLGFDILTYKTIRSGEYPAHRVPNMVYVDTQDSPAEGKAALLASVRPSRIEKLAVTNSFGMPSRSRSYLLDDIPKAQASLQPGQALIVSIVGTPRNDCSFLEDFVVAAHLAKEAGARIVEANFSCPNVDKKDGLLYTSEEAVTTIGKSLVKALHPLPLIIKVGLFSSHQQMRHIMLAAARAGVQGFAGINTVSMRVLNAQGESALGKMRPTSGVCGGPIRELALQFTRQAHAINQEEKLDLTLLSCGGIMLPEHFTQFLEAGAHIATTATGMMWDPYLAARYHLRFL
jgi:dihydroorotate dehydrogenase